MENKVTARNPITEGCIWKGMLLFALPIMLGSLLQQLYNTADAVIVGRALGKAALASVGGSSARITNLLVNAFVALSSGASVIVAQHFGARDTQRVRRSICTAMLLSVVCGILLTVLGITSARQLLVWMQTTPETLDASASYLRIFFLGMVPTMLYNMGSGILRAMGDSKRPLYYLIVCCFVNIGLDLLFVVVLKMEVAGAALATILSQLLSAALVMWTLMRTKESFRFELKHLKVDKPMLRKIIQIGFPAGLQSVLYSISNVVIQANINSFGTNVIAAWAVYGKVDGLFWMIMDAMGIAITTFAGQNFGARKYERMQKGHYVGLGITTILTAILAAGVMLFGSILGSLFTSDPDVLAESMTIIRFVTPFWFSYICVNVFSSTLRGIGDTFIPMLLICFGTCGLRVLWIFTAGVMYPGLYTSLASYPLSWTVTSVAFIIYYYKFSDMRRINKLIKKEKKERQ